HYGIKVIGFDVVFAEEDRSSGLTVLEQLASNELRGIPEFTESLAELRPRLEIDRIFAESFQNRNVVLGIIFYPNSDVTKGTLPEPVAGIDTKWLNQLPISSPDGYIANLPIHQKYAMTAGFFDN